MNRRQLTISAALLAVVIVVFGYFVWFGGSGPGSRPAPPTGPGQAGEARGIIAEIEERRSEESERPVAARQPDLIGRSDTEQEPAGAGAVAVTPAPPPAAPTGAGTELDDAFERAMELQADGQLDDAQLLYFFGARQGHGPSAFHYAEMNDPLHHSAGSSLLPEPDPGVAFRYYRIAENAGYPDAGERLEALHQWTIDAAAAGDIDAEMLLVQWER